MTDIIQQLTNEAYGKWQYSNDWTLQDFRNYIKENLTQQHLIAVQVASLNYHVENGGFYQWYINGCSIDLKDLISHCESIASEACIEVREILEGVKDIISLCQNESGPVIELLLENGFTTYAHILHAKLKDYMRDKLKFYDKRYRSINDIFLSDVETYLTKIREEGGKKK